LKSFCEVGYANFWPNVFAAGKRMSMEILVVVGLHALCPAAFKKICCFFKKRKCARKTFIVFVTLSDLNKTSNRVATTDRPICRPGQYIGRYLCFTDISVSAKTADRPQ